MTFRLCGALIAAASVLGVVSVSAQQQKPTIAIMPSQYFSASPESAKNLTDGLVTQFQNQGYTVISMDQASQKFQGMGLQPSQNYPDHVAVKFGAQLGADLVAYPRLMVLGIPVNADLASIPGWITPAAVAHLRVINVHTGWPLYCRQVGHDLTPVAATTTTTTTTAGTGTTSTTAVATDFVLPQPDATAVADQVAGMYFQRVAGSRQEFRGSSH